VKTLKNSKPLLAAILIGIIAILIGIIAILPIPYAYSSTLTLTIFTTKPSYTIGEDITIYGNLTYNSSPVPDWPVALEIQDPVGTPVVTRTLQTNTSGTYTLTFKLQAPGTYTAYVSSSYKGETATNNATFELIKVGDLGGGMPPQFFNRDGKVDGKDLALFLQCYRGTAPPEAMYLGDLGGGIPPQFFNCDGKVDGKDLALFLLCFKGQGP
jgi:hypothetical protein